MNRKELKASSKEAFYNNYWMMVLLNLIYAAIIGAGELVVLIIGGPMNLGLMAVLCNNKKGEKTNPGQLFKGFSNFGNALVGFLLSAIYTFLWSLLLIVPGIIKSLSYALVPYLQSKDSTLSGKEAIKKSQELMNGHKWELFVLELSFIGWHLLSALTCGVLEVFFVAPYFNQTLYAFYEQVAGEQVEVIEAEPQE